MTVLSRMTVAGRARRVTIYKAHDGWRYRVQASNWRIIEASEQPFAQVRSVRSRVAKRYPGVEVVEVIEHGA